MMGNLKKFVGEYAYNTIKNIAVNNEALHNALITPQNARAVFEDLNEFEIKALCTEISNSGIMGQIRETTQSEIVEAFNLAGYSKVIFDDEKGILDCKKYYKQGEVICTYNNLRSRMQEYFMVVAVKKNIDKIKRSKSPQRDDEYGTSILNIQIARNGSHMSIKNRYNHTVLQPDCTLNNNLDILYPGLQSMVLGYYGFASLNNKKSHYDNIVNINNIYLKYHTERNNVYFGEFLLDGVNGVRFSDTSRYYVTGKETKNDYYNEPIVLDFKEKKAIDIVQDQKQLNGRVPLLTRALREGILSSANKVETDTLNAIFHDARKELLLSRKNALKYIHEAYGYDFTKPYKVTGFLGKFTAKSIEKTTGSNTGILLLYAFKTMYICVMNRGKFYVRDLMRMYQYNINTFYTQSDFETIRKSGNAAMYFIQQEKQYIEKPKQIERKTYYTYQEIPTYDKSGYNLTETRNNLYRRLNKYKVEKRAKEASEVNYTHDITEISNSFDELKMDIITHLTKAKTSNDYEIIDNVINYKLTWLVRDLEKVKKHAEEKSFTSIDSARNMIEKVKTRIKELKLKLS